ncbi:hypothetical protein D3C78_965460 [compost metagenome]
MQGSQQFDQRIEQGPGIGVVGMHLIEDHHLAGEAKGADKSMLDVHRRHQSLVESADGKGGQQATLGMIEPGTSGATFFAHFGIQQPGIAMQQQGAMLAILRQNATQKFVEALVNLV